MHAFVHFFFKLNAHFAGFFWILFQRSCVLEAFFSCFTPVFAFFDHLCNCIQFFLKCSNLFLQKGPVLPQPQPATSEESVADGLRRRTADYNARLHKRPKDEALWARPLLRDVD